MKKNDQIRALIDAYTELAKRHNYSERSTIEALMDIFEPKELAELGYRKRVTAYLKEYGCGEDVKNITQ